MIFICFPFKDPFGTLSYTIVGGGNGNSYFTIVRASNNDVDVMLSQSLVGTMAPEYRVIVHFVNNACQSLVFYMSL